MYKSKSKTKLKKNRIKKHKLFFPRIKSKISNLS